MNHSLEPRDELTDRLRALGRHPVDSALQSQHLTAMAGVPAATSFRRALGSRIRLGAAVMAGFLLGTTGLATAGVLGPLQPIASKGVEAVTPLEVPKGRSAEAKARAAEAKAARAEAKGTRPGAAANTPRYFGPECVPAGDGKPNARNRGQYLKQERAKGPAALAAAKASNCGKPMSSLTDDAAKDQKAQDSADANKTGDNSGEADKRGKRDEVGKTDQAGKADEAGEPDPARDPDQADEDEAAKADKGARPDKAGKSDSTGKTQGQAKSKKAKDGERSKGPNAQKRAEGPADDTVTGAGDDSGSTGTTGS